MSTATQSLQPWVDRVRRSWRASPLPGFLGWWGGELRGMLPPRWRGWFGGGADWHLLQHAGAQWSLRRSGHDDVLASWDDGAEAVTDEGHVTPLALNAALQRVDREDLRLALLLRPAVVLRRMLALPLAARDNLLQVAGFEMDRQTPFTVAQVHYAVRELDTPAAPGRFNAELVVVTRDTLDPLLARLRAQGIDRDALTLRHVLAPPWLDASRCVCETFRKASPARQFFIRKPWPDYMSNRPPGPSGRVTKV